MFSNTNRKSSVSGEFRGEKGGKFPPPKKEAFAFFKPHFWAKKYEKKRSTTGRNFDFQDFIDTLF